jgi:hypothetical protein
VVNAVHSNYWGKTLVLHKAQWILSPVIQKTITVIFVMNLKGTPTILHFITEPVKDGLDFTGKVDLKRVIDYITINLDYCSIF